MSDMIVIAVAGITTGSIYGIIALAFTLIYNSTKIVNFAQGQFIMVGAMLAYFFLTAKEMFAGGAVILVVLIAGLVVGLGTKILIVDPLQRRGAPLFSKIIATLALGIVLAQTAAMMFGKTKFNVPPLVEGDPIQISAEIGIWPENITVIVVTLLSVIAFWFFLNRTDLGRAIQAVGYNAQAAQLAGLKVSSIIGATFVLSAGISAIGGILIAPIMGASPYMGLSLGIKGFAATILGGMGNPFAGFVGGLILGLAETYSSYYISTTYAPVIAYLVLLIMLIVKPTGIWPEREGA